MIKMDEKEYLRTKEKIKEYRTVAYPLGVGAGIVAIIVGLVLYVLCMAFRTSVILTFVVIALGTFILLAGLWAKGKARDLEIELEVYDKQKQQAVPYQQPQYQPPSQAYAPQPVQQVPQQMPQQPISQITQPTAQAPQLQFCPFCGKSLQPGWQVCGYCGKKIGG